MCGKRLACDELSRVEAAAAVARKIFEKADKVGRFRLLGRPIPEFPVAGYRQLWIRPCWIYYRISRKEILILHVRRGESRFDIDDLDE